LRSDLPNYVAEQALAIVLSCRLCPCELPAALQAPHTLWNGHVKPKKAEPAEGPTDEQLAAIPNPCARCRVRSRCPAILCHDAGMMMGCAICSASILSTVAVAVSARSRRFGLSRDALVHKFMLDRVAAKGTAGGGGNELLPSGAGGDNRDAAEPEPEPEPELEVRHQTSPLRVAVTPAV
jgi:hypothetical protein